MRVVIGRAADTLLVPVVSLLSSATLLGEPLPPWKLIAAGLVLAGVGVNLGAASRRTPNA